MNRMTYGNLQLNLAADGCWLLTYGITILGRFVSKGDAISAFNKRKWQLKGER